MVLAGPLTQRPQPWRPDTRLLRCTFFNIIALLVGILDEEAVKKSIRQTYSVILSISLEHWHDGVPWSELFEIFDHVHVFDPVEPRAKHAVACGGVVPAAYDQRGEWEVHLSPWIGQPRPETEGRGTANGDVGVSESGVVEKLIPAALHHHLYMKECVGVCVYDD